MIDVASVAEGEAGLQTDNLAKGKLNCETAREALPRGISRRKSADILCVREGIASQPPFHAPVQRARRLTSALKETLNERSVRLTRFKPRVA